MDVVFLFLFLFLGAFFIRSVACFPRFPPSFIILSLDSHPLSLSWIPIKMHIKEYTPRLNFLKAAASSLSPTSPSTAAYLMSVHNTIFHEEQKPLNQRLHDNFCCACGSPRKGEWTKTALIKKNNQKRVTSSLAKGLTADGVTVYKCLRCRRRTVTQSRTPSRASPPPATVLIADSQSSASTATTALPDQMSASKTAENASSKKRAKARKQGGLQALLASKQSRTDSTQSLDLFDFFQ
ncbi:hypothetical protein BDW59DRAFT_18388 [Aspergillus cavernicola]|uniref:RNAse P Rpr2/Rpp21/SNM1 subunit domain-containing protein n=1 Tax=Aspergillus cavernicola TaxID=176166 RepID=A0ABR4IRZ6_9EURO